MSTSYEEELALENYRTARSEIVARVQHRDGALLAYTVAVGGYAALLFNLYKDSPDHIPFPLESALFGLTPFVSLFFTLIILHHDYIIHVISVYIRAEFPQKKTANMNQWFSEFYELKRKGRSEWLPVFTDLRFYGQLIPLSLPVFFSAAYAIKNYDNVHGWQMVVFCIICVLDALILGAIFYLHLWVRRERRKLHADVAAWTRGKSRPRSA